MKVAFTVWEDRISPLFDASQKLLIVEIRNAKVCSRQYEAFQPEMPIRQALRLCELEIDVLVCGAISEMPSAMIDAYGISLIPFIAGKSEDVLNAYINNKLNEPVFQMPGCRFRCRRYKKNAAIHSNKNKEVIMPGRDGTGPDGQGPFGRGKGGCKDDGTQGRGSGKGLKKGFGGRQGKDKTGTGQGKRGGGRRKG